jgi:hypothetical protein
MEKTYDSLPSVALSKANTYTHPEVMPELVHLDDSALDVMVDFKVVKPATARSQDSIDDMLVKMRSLGRHILLVIAKKSVVGVVGVGDLQGEKPLRLAQISKVARKDILVDSVMTPVDQLLAIDYEVIRFAKVGQIVATLREADQRYALVVDVDEKTGHQTVHGSVSLYDIVHRLDKDVPIALRKKSLSVLELQRRLLRSAY